MNGSAYHCPECGVVELQAVECSRCTEQNQNMTPTTIYVASAGCGKTTALMSELEAALKQSTPEQIVFTTFTNAGAQEIAHRASEQFPQFKEHQFRYFRTLHSIGYRNIPRKNLLSFHDYIQLSKELGLPINAKRVFSTKDYSAAQNFSKGDHLLHLDSLARNKCLSWKEIAGQQPLTHFSPKEIQDFSESFKLFRQKSNKYDFTDQLELFLEQLEHWNPKLTHLFIDEAQDLTPLQWEILDQLSLKCQKTVIAGDDKQAIYGFNGGDPTTLIRKKGVRNVLDTTYRLPEKVLTYAEKIASRIQNKQNYSCKAAQKGGEVKWIQGINDLQKEFLEGTWFILARNRKFIEPLELTLSKMGVLFTSDSKDAPLNETVLEAIISWKDLCRGYAIEARIAKSIYQNFLRGSDTVARGFKKTIQTLDDSESVTYKELIENFGLQTNLPWDQCFSLSENLKNNLLEIEKNEGLAIKPRIRITTIHAVKGREADNVVLLPDLSKLTLQEYRTNPDEEHRVFYVGVTRAKKRLFLHQPITDDYYSLPQP